MADSASAESYRAFVRQALSEEPRLTFDGIQQRWRVAHGAFLAGDEAAQCEAVFTAETAARRVSMRTQPTLPGGDAPGLTLASFWQRGGALVVDRVFMVAVGVILARILGLVGVLQSVGVVAYRTGQPPESHTYVFGQEWLVALLIALEWAYFAGAESSRWQATIGKRLFHLRVTDLAGRRIAFWRASARCWGHWLSALPLLAGFAMQPFSRRGQALHDRVTGCLVVVQGLGLAPAAAAGAPAALPASPEIVQ